MIRCRLFLILCLIFVMTGCAGHQMALTKGMSGIDVTKKSLALLSVKICNKYKPKYQLELVCAAICPPNETCGRSLKYLHRAGPPFNSVEDSFNEYLLSFELESGTYILHSIGALYNHFPISGGGTAPLNIKIEIKPNSINYLGHLDIVMRERKKESEQRAGPITPLIDQATVGSSSGTFDVVVEDKFDGDMKLFISEYPALQNVKVEKSILQQWIRPENQPANN